MAEGQEGSIDLDAMVPGPVRASMRRLAKSMLAAGDTTCVKVALLAQQQEFLGVLRR